MPSPIGHTLIGLTIAGAALLPPASPRSLLREAWRRRWTLAGCVALANAPDIDYVPGIIAGEFNRFHHYYTHSIGWCLLAGLGVWAALRLRRSPGLGLGLILALLASHLIADALTADSSLPYGIMLGWPLSDAHVISPVTIFPRLMKSDYSEFICWHNALAVLAEVAWCMPALLVTGAVKAIRAEKRGEPGSL